MYTISNDYANKQIFLLYKKDKNRVYVKDILINGNIMITTNKSEAKVITKEQYNFLLKECPKKIKDYTLILDIRHIIQKQYKNQNQYLKKIGYIFDQNTQTYQFRFIFSDNIANALVFNTPEISLIKKSMKTNERIRNMNLIIRNIN